MKDYYEILGIDITATQEQIKKAFRVNAVRYHPDKNSGDTEFTQKFIEVKEAFDVLIDTTLKKEYDLEYKCAFGKQDTVQNVQVKQQKQESAKKQYKTEEEFRFNPFKPFYSSYDRDQQETAQIPPQQTPWGDKLNENVDFFMFPKSIGKIIGGYSSLYKGVKAISPKQQFISVLKTLLIGIPIAFGISLVIYIIGSQGQNENSLDPFNFSLGAFFVSLTVILIFLFSIKSGENKFEHICYFIGVNGFAYYKCQDTRDNIVSKSEINFNDITDMISRSEVRKLNFEYSNTMFQFLFINTKTGKYVFEGNGVYYDKNGDPNKYGYPDYWVCKEAEKYWTVYLLDNMENVLEENGYLEFNIFSFEKNLFIPYIRIGIGFITFLKGEESVKYKFNEIKKMYTKSANLFIEHQNYEKKIFFFKSGNQDSIPLINLGNRQFFYKALELLLGYKID